MPADATESPYAGIGRPSGPSRGKRPLPADSDTPGELPAEVGADGSFFWGEQDRGHQEKRPRDSSHRGGRNPLPTRTYSTLPSSLLSPTPFPLLQRLQLFHTHIYMYIHMYNFTHLGELVHYHTQGYHTHLDKHLLRYKYREGEIFSRLLLLLPIQSRYTDTPDHKHWQRLIHDNVPGALNHPSH